jgi:15-cis-phytoene synthase
MHKPLAPEVQASLDRCRHMIRVGSKSFSLAARLFSPETKNAAFFLYGWCRYCDDEVDLDDGSTAAEDRIRRLVAIRQKTRSALAGQPQSDPVFIAFRHVVERYAIPEHYPLELLEGMAMDVRAERYRTLDDLRLYCYRVAGTVGLMMAHIMGVSDERALRHAADLGIAMQLTNIARDIFEDVERGRIYLPLSWLEEEKVPPAEITAPRHRHKIAAVVARLLDEAEKYYRSGDEGFRYLAVRSAFAIAAARQVYSEIGRLVRLKGAHAWDERTYVPLSRKLWVVGRGVVSVLKSPAGRWHRRWEAAPITMVWKFSQTH